jgi:uncharacterized protein YjgD (DUF1641 family)
MAQPITLKIAPRDPKQELLSRLENAPVEHAAALLDGYELLQQLHEHGVFEMVRGGLHAKEKIVEDLALGASAGESIRALRNLMILAKMLGSIDPAFLQSLSDAAGETLGNAKIAAEKPPGVFATVRRLLGSSPRIGVSLLLSFLEKAGSNLKLHKSE